jgi:hypothetical protein
LQVLHLLFLLPPNPSPIFLKSIFPVTLLGMLSPGQSGTSGACGIAKHLRNDANPTANEPHSSHTPLGKAGVGVPANTKTMSYALQYVFSPVMADAFYWILGAKKGQCPIGALGIAQLCISHPEHPRCTRLPSYAHPLVWCLVRPMLQALRTVLLSAMLVRKCCGWNPWC